MAMENLTSSDGTVSQAALGEYRIIKGAGYLYVKAGGAIAAFACAHVSSAMSALEITTTLMGTVTRPTPIVIPQFIVASGEFFWGATGPFYLREDDSTTFKVLAANSTLALRMYTTATAGVLDDAVTTGLIEGLTLTETITTQEAADCVAVKNLTSFCEL